MEKTFGWGWFFHVVNESGECPVNDSSDGSDDCEDDISLADAAIDEEDSNMWKEQMMATILHLIELLLVKGHTVWLDNIYSFAALARCWSTRVPIVLRL